MCCAVQRPFVQGKGNVQNKSWQGLRERLARLRRKAELNRDSRKQSRDLSRDPHFNLTAPPSLISTT